MFKNFVNFLKNGNIYNAVEVISSSDSKDVFYFIKLKRKKNELTVLESVKIESLDDVLFHIKPTEPFFLVVNTNKVLSKIIERTGKDGKDTVNRAFPNIQLDDFYYEIQWAESFGIVSICRKELIENIIKNITVSKTSLSGFSIGFTKICVILPLLGKDSLQMAAATLDLEISPPQFTLSDNTDSKPVYKIDEIELGGDYLLSFSELISGLTKNNSSGNNLGQRNQSLRQGFYYNVFYNKFIRFGIVFLFILLFFNFLLFNFYFQKTNQLEQVSESNSSSIEFLKAKDNIVSDKEKKLSDLLYAITSKSSLYLDRISSTVSDSIQFLTIDYQPYVKKVVVTEAVSVKVNFIAINGLSTTHDGFSKWLTRLQKYKWIKNVAIVDFVKNKNGLLYDFEILIEIQKDGL